MSGRVTKKPCRCAWCDAAFEQAARGRPRKYCDGVCKQAAWREAQRELTPGEWRALARYAISEARRERVDGFGGYAAVERDEKRWGA